MALEGVPPKVEANLSGSAKVTGLSLPKYNFFEFPLALSSIHLL
jgi:hypothetical protein